MITSGLAGSTTDVETRRDTIEYGYAGVAWPAFSGDGWPDQLCHLPGGKDSPGHEDAVWLPKLGAVITDGADPSTLNDWPAWRETGVDDGSSPP